jgi:hypothetical protein
MASSIRISDRMTQARADVARAGLRVVLYGVLGVFFEVASFPIVRVGRMIPVIKYLFAFDSRPDPRLALDGPWHSPLETLFGQTSLWMIPIYMLAALLIEMLYRNVLLHRSWIFRAITYGLVILILELGTGLIVHWITGYRIWMYYDRGNILQTTSLFILPIWMIIGLLVELLYRELMNPGLRILLEARLRQPEPATR